MDIPDTTPANPAQAQQSDRPLSIPADVAALLQDHASRAHPFECCGIVFGHGDTITRAIRARNIHPDPLSHFEVDPQALIDAHRSARSQAHAQVLGYYHSHPNGPAHPSATDRASAAGDGMIWLIVTGEGAIGAWRDDKSGFTRLTCATECA